MNAPHPLLTATHEVANQVPVLSGHNLYASDAALRDAVARDGAADSVAWLAARGAELGSTRMQQWAEQANRVAPTLRVFDPTGRRLDTVEFHPAYHELMAYLKRHGAAAGPWADPVPGAHVRRAALYVMFAQVEDGTLCPTTMTYACVPPLARDAALAPQWLPRIFSPEYDPRFLPAGQKTGVTLGMGMTEKQGGSDVRTNTTRAEPACGRAWRIVGHKWFLSAPMCDAFLILAQAPAGPSCFLLPRFQPDGSVNDIRIQRLKDKLGTARTRVPRSSSGTRTGSSSARKDEASRRS